MTRNRRCPGGGQVDAPRDLRPAGKFERPPVTGGELRRLPVAHHRPLVGQAGGEALVGVTLPGSLAQVDDREAATRSRVGVGRSLGAPRPRLVSVVAHGEAIPRPAGLILRGPGPRRPERETAGVAGRIESAWRLGCRRAGQRHRQATRGLRVVGGEQARRGQHNSRCRHDRAAGAGAASRPRRGRRCCRRDPRRRRAARCAARRRSRQGGRPRAGPAGAPRPGCPGPTTTFPCGSRGAAARCRLWRGRSPPVDVGPAASLSGSPGRRAGAVPRRTSSRSATVVTGRPAHPEVALDGAGHPGRGDHLAGRPSRDRSSTTEWTSVVAPPTSTTTTSPATSARQLDAGEHDVRGGATDHRGEVGARAQALAPMTWARNISRMAARGRLGCQDADPWDDVVGEHVGRSPRIAATRPARRRSRRPPRRLQPPATSPGRRAPRRCLRRCPRSAATSAGWVVCLSTRQSASWGTRPQRRRSGRPCRRWRALSPGGLPRRSPARCRRPRSAASPPALEQASTRRRGARVLLDQGGLAGVVPAEHVPAAVRPREGRRVRCGRRRDGSPRRGRPGRLGEGGPEVDADDDAWWTSVTERSVEVGDQGRRRSRCRRWRRTRSAGTSRSVPATLAWVIRPGCSMSDSTPPSDSPRVNTWVRRRPCSAWDRRR